MYIQYCATFMFSDRDLYIAYSKYSSKDHPIPASIMQDMIPAILYNNTMYGTVELCREMYKNQQTPHLS